MINRARVYDALQREYNYSLGWGGEDHDKKWSLMDWLIFAEKYLDEAKIGYASYTSDIRGLQQRFLKAASLLVTALQYHATEQDLQDVAGISSSKFPINSEGLVSVPPEPREEHRGNLPEIKK